MYDLYIQSPKNERIKAAMGAQTRKGRECMGVFFFEGLREIQRAQAAQLKFHTVYVCFEYWRQKEADGLALLDVIKKTGVMIIGVTRPVFDKMSMREGPDGWAALGYPWDMTFNALNLQQKPLSLVLACEGLEKPGNLGAIIRSAESAGVDALVVCDSLIDILSPAVIRNSQGAIFSLPIVNCFNEEAYAYFIKHKLQILASTPHTDTLYWSAQFQKPTAILMGNEHTGLTSFWLNQAHDKVKIPLAGASDSLNVAAASVLILYEALRQRSYP
jgi:TrmH family RNA methyltransferase